MKSLARILTFARWDVRRSLVVPGRRMLPHAIILIVLLCGVFLFTGQAGLHLQDDIYTAGTDYPAVSQVISADQRFRTYLLPQADLVTERRAFDLIVLEGNVLPARTAKGTSAASSLKADYERYKNMVYSEEADIFAAYPLLIEEVTVKSELDFSAPGGAIRTSSAPQTLPAPTGPVEYVPPPDTGQPVSSEELRASVVKPSDDSIKIGRYSTYLTGETDTGPYKTPSQLSPPLPFDAIILIFIFVFPLYFISQFLMMSVMNERIERNGEALLSAPVRSWEILAGKALPYAAGMLIVAAGITLFIRASPQLLLPLIPIILFFLSAGILIGMASRSFRELSFISIFFSTIATAYLFFPSIFADIHVISLVSPVTLMIMTLEHETYTLGQYVFSTSLFYLSSIVFLYIAVVNFREERLFSLEGIFSRTINYISSAITPLHPWLSLSLFGLLIVPFVFMAQLLVLVVVFNLPLPLSVLVLLVIAAAIEELAKSLGIYAFATRYPKFFTWKVALGGAIVTAFAFLVAEKLLLLVTVTQIAESVFGAVLFSTVGLLIVPFAIHAAGILITSIALKLKGSAGYLPGLAAATIVHCSANIYLLWGWLT